MLELSLQQELRVMLLSISPSRKGLYIWGCSVRP